MAKIISVTQTYADIERGDVTAVYDDEEDEGAEVRRSALFRVTRVPGQKSAYMHLIGVAPTEEGRKAPKKYFTRSIDLDAIEASEVAKKGRALDAAEECSVSTKGALDALVTTKADADVRGDVKEELP